jgi:hypothetical protein
VAAERCAASGFASSLFSRLSDVPLNTYDFVAVNSVLQYLPSVAAVEGFFADCARWLRIENPRAFVVVGDLIPQSYSKYIDAINCLWYSAQHSLAVPMVRHLARNLTKPRECRLLQLDFEAVSQAAAASGFIVEKLKRNLTPSKSRYSIVARRVQDGQSPARGS